MDGGSSICLGWSVLSTVTLINGAGSLSLPLWELQVKYLEERDQNSSFDHFKAVLMGSILPLLSCFNPD